MQRSSELEDLVRAWFEAATRGDASLVDTLVSSEEGTCLIGSDPGERFSGGPAVAEFLRGEVEGSGGQAKFAPTETEAFSENTVGWATTSLTITMPEASTCPHAGVPSFTKRTATGNSSRRTPRSASRTTPSAGCIPAEQQSVGSPESSTTRRARVRKTLRSTLGCLSTRCRKSFRVRTKKRSGVLAVTVAIRGVCSSKAISPKYSLPVISTGLPFLVTSTSPSMITKNSCPTSPSFRSTLPGGTSRSSDTRASSASSLRERSSKRAARPSASTLVACVNSFTRLP